MLNSDLLSHKLCSIPLDEPKAQGKKTCLCLKGKNLFSINKDIILLAFKFHILVRKYYGNHIEQHEL